MGRFFVQQKMMFSKFPAWMYGIPFVGYAVLLVAIDGPEQVVLVTSGLLVANVIVYRLPWRVPRDDRTPLGYWLEALICSLSMGSCALMWLAFAPNQVCAQFPARWAPLWFVSAVLVGLALVRLARTSWRALLNGDLAFLAGPLPPHRAAARTWMIAISIVSEEVVFRGLPAGLARNSTLALIAGGLAFVTGHHLIRGNSSRNRWRWVRYEITAALMFGGLVVASGSIWPTIAAHVVANLPSTILHWQRARMAMIGPIRSGTQTDKVTI